MQTEEGRVEAKEMIAHLRKKIAHVDDEWFYW